ncbi:MAG: glycosyltransferase [Bacteroidales bacterium]|nr:glycosyltransferase [Bacteroidales bacterium]
MKILQLTNKVPYPPRDGGAIATLALTEGLAAQGHQVTVLAMNTTKHHTDVSQSPSPKWRLISAPVNTRIKPLSALFNLLFSRLPYNGVRFRSAKYRETLISLLRKTPFDIIIIENLYPALYLKEIRSHSRARIMLRSHNLEHEIWLGNRDNTRGLKKWYLNILAQRIKRFEIRMVQSCDALIPITERDALKFKQLGNRLPTFILPAGLDEERLGHPSDSSGKITLAYLGALDWLPNQSGIKWFLDKIWPSLIRNYPDLEFHIAGRNAPARFIRQLHHKGVIYHGEIRDAGTFIKAHPITLVPLFAGSGMRIKILENMAAGRVVITTPVGCEGIPAVDGKHLFICSDSGSWINRIRQLISQPGIIPAVGENAITFVREKYLNKILITQFSRFLTEWSNDSNHHILV